jgi:hypothetical protein
MKPSRQQQLREGWFSTLEAVSRQAVYLDEYAALLEQAVALSS